jgi:hypothetical protein
MGSCHSVDISLSLFSFLFLGCEVTVLLDSSERDKHPWSSVMCGWDVVSQRGSELVRERRVFSFSRLSSTASTSSSPGHHRQTTIPFVQA